MYKVKLINFDITKIFYDVHTAFNWMRNSGYECACWLEDTCIATYSPISGFYRMKN